METKAELCVMGVSDASYQHDDRSAARDLIMLGNQKTGKAAPIHWRSGVIRRFVCHIAWSSHHKAVITVNECKYESKIV